MTISATINRVTYSGNGVTVDFPFPYPIAAETDLTVIATVTATGAFTTKLLSTHYTFTGTPDAAGHFPNGGTVTALIAPPSTEIWTIFRDPPATQGLDLVENDGAPAEAQEAQFDYLTMLAQRTRERVDRTVHQNDADTVAMSALPSTILRANKYLYFDSSGNPNVVNAASASGTSVTATGSTTARLLADRFAEQFHVYDYGAVCDGTTNDSTAIQAAITAAGVAGGRVVFPPKVCALATGLTNIYNNVLLVGAGEGANRGGADDSGSAATVLKWTGSAGGTMYDLGPAVSAQHNITGGGILGIFFNGNKVAGTGVLLRSVRNNRFNMMIAETTVVGLNLTVEPTVTVDPGDTQTNWFEQVIVSQQDVTSGICVQLNGATTPVAGADASLNTFSVLRLLHYNGTALDIVRADSNVFLFTSIYRAAAGSGTGMVLHAGTTPAYARGNVFAHFLAGDGGVISQGTASGTQPAVRNTILFYNTENASPDPTIGVESSLTYSTNLGKDRVSRALTAAVSQLHRGQNTAAAQLGRYEFVGHDAANAESTYGYIDGRIVTNTAGAEDGEVRVIAKVAGVDTVLGTVRAGWQIGAAPTGGSLGVGTLNAKGNLFKNGASVTGQNIITYSASMTPDHQLGSVQRITVSNGTAFTINDPINSITGVPFKIIIRNASGGAHGAITWGAGYKMGGALAAIATANSRTVEFHYDGTNWVEMFRSAADVAN